MQENEHFDRLIRLFQSAPINRGIFKNSSIDLAEGKAEYLFKVDQSFFHGANALHGAIYFKLLDDAAYFVAATLMTDFFLVTKSYELQFVRPVHLERLIAKGQVIERSEHEIKATSEIYNEQGKLVAKGTGVFVSSKKYLVELEGYA